METYINPVSGSIMDQKAAQRIVDAEFTSVWDDGVQISSPCKVNLDTKEVFDIESADVDPEDMAFLEETGEEYITLLGENFNVVCKDGLDEGETLDGYWYKW